MKNSRKYIFFDIDGTLTLPSGGPESVPESTREALRRLREAGHFTALATGRSHAMSVEIMTALGFENMVSDGGYGLTVNGKLLEIEPLNRADCIALVNECKARGFPWGIQPEDSVCRFVPDERFMDATHDTYMGTKIVPGLDPEDYEQIYKVYVACPAPEEYTLESLKKLPWCRFMDTYIFVEPADKARGIRRMTDLLGGAYKDVAVFGDERNDLSMFRKEWTNIAMGNAVQELKVKADYVTADIQDGGILKACEHFGWI